MYRNKKLIKQEHLQKLKGNWTVAELKISYKPLITDHTIISSSFQAYGLIKQLWDQEKINLQEQFAALFFDQSNKVIGWGVISTGKMTSCYVDIKLLISLALHCICTHVMVVHNHPSGNLKPSASDETITNTMKDALMSIDVRLLDHLIIVEDGYYFLVMKDG